MATRYNGYVFDKATNTYIQIMRAPTQGGADYDELVNLPITNLYGTDYVYVDISTLEPGKYIVSGKYKLDDHSNMETAITPMEVTVTEDAVTGKKVATYPTIEDGKYVLNIAHFEDFAVTGVDHNIIGDTSEIDQQIDLISQDLAEVKEQILSAGEQISQDIEDVQGQVDQINNELDVLNGDVNTTGSIQKSIKDQIDAYDTQVSAELDTINDTLTQLQGNENVQGSIEQITKSAIDDFDSTLSTVSKSGQAADLAIADESNKFTATNVEGALTELDNKIATTQTQSDISISVAQAPDQGDSTTYIIRQGNIEKGKIHLAKDLVATSGELTSVDGQGNEGTFLKMTIANGTPFYIPVQDLIDVYVGSGDRTSITSGIEVKVLDGVISATLKSVDGALIDQKTITADKLTQSIQDKLAHIQEIDQQLTKHDNLLTWNIIAGFN